MRKEEGSDMILSQKAVEAAVRATALADLDQETRGVIDLDAHLLHVRAHYEELVHAALSAALAVDGLCLVQGWQQIETAPKDGTGIDLWVPVSSERGKRVPDAWWDPY